MNTREMGLPSGIEHLRFPYRGESVQVPVAPSFLSLKQAIHRAVIPGLEELSKKRQPGEIIGVGFVTYQYATDGLEFQNPEATQALIQHLKAAGLPVADTPKKLDPIAPERYSLLTQMRQRRDYYYPLDYFRGGTFVIGPVVIADTPRHPWFYDYAAELEAATLHTDLSVAVHGETLLADVSFSSERDRIFNEEIVEILTRAFHPYPLQ